MGSQQPLQKQMHPHIFDVTPLWVTDKKCSDTCFFISGQTHSHSLFNDHLIFPTKQRALAKIFHSDLLADVQFQRIWLDVFTSLHETGCKSVPLLRKKESQDLQTLASFMISYEYLLKIIGNFRWTEIAVYHMSNTLSVQHVKEYFYLH